MPKIRTAAEILRLVFDEENLLLKTGLAGDSAFNSSGVGGGNSTYSNIYNDFVATPNVGAKTITFSSYANTLLSAAIANINFLNGVIKKISSAGVVTNIPLTNVSFSAGVLTLSDMEENFANGDSVAVFIEGPVKAYDKTNDLVKMIMGAALGKSIDSITASPEGTIPVPLTASGVISNAPCKIVGFYVCSTSNGVIQLYDNASAGSGTTIGGNITPAVGPHAFFSPQTSLGAYMTLVSGSINIIWFMI